MGPTRAAAIIAILILLPLHPVSATPVAEAGDGRAAAISAGIAFRDASSRPVIDAIQGETVTITVNLTNTGDENLTDSDVTFYDNGTPIGSPHQGKRVDAGSYLVLSQSWNTAGLPLGNHTVRVGVTNATLGYNFTAPFNITPPPAPYLTVESVEAPDAGVLGDILSIVAFLRNTGTAPAVNGSVLMYPDLSATPVCSTAATVGASGTEYIQLLWNTTGFSEGNHTLKVIVPSTGSWKRSGNLSLFAPRADVIIANISFSPPYAPVGARVTINASLRNAGTGPATGETVTFDVNGRVVGAVGVNLARDGTTYAALTWDTSAFPAGTNLVQVSTSPSGRFLRKEYNLTGTPNITVESVELSSASVRQGENVTVTATLRNSGTADAVSVPVVFSLEGMDVWQTSVNVSRGAAVRVPLLIVVNGSTGPGAVSVAVAAGGDRRAAALSVTGLPRLEAREFSTGGTAYAGSPLAISAVLLNNGTADFNGTLLLYDGGTLVEERGANISRGAQADFLFTFVPATPGTRQIHLDSRLKNETAPVASMAFNVSGAMRAVVNLVHLRASKTTVTSGTTIRVEVTLNNTGSSVGNVTLFVNDDVSRSIIARENVSVPPGKNIVKTYSWKAGRSGNHRLTAVIGGSEAGTSMRAEEVSVLPAPRQPGFEVVLAGAAAVVVALICRRRHA